MLKKINPLSELGIRCEFIRNNRAKRYIVRFTDSKQLRVTIPAGGSQKEAEQFIAENIDEIQKKLASIEPPKIEKDDLFSEQYKYKTLFHTVKIILNKPENRISIKEHQAFIHIEDSNTETDKSQEIIKEAFKFLLRKEAQYYLPKRTFELAQKFNFNFKQVKINTAQGRWGSCSSSNSINFSLFLMNLPKEMIDYVVLHELCHTIHKNHSPAFWELLDRCVKGQNEALRKEMKKYSTNIKAKYYEKINFATDN